MNWTNPTTGINYIYWTQVSIKTNLPEHSREEPLQEGLEGLTYWRKAKYRKISSTFTHLYSEALCQLSARVKQNPRRKLNLAK